VKLTLNEKIYLILAIVNFLIFAYDIEKDRDFFTWTWLLSSILWFMYFLKESNIQR
jgi:hypothetical protein